MISQNVGSVETWSTKKAQMSKKLDFSHCIRKISLIGKVGVALIMRCSVYNKEESKNFITLNKGAGNPNKTESSVILYQLYLFLELTK